MDFLGFWGRLGLCVGRNGFVGLRPFGPNPTYGLPWGASEFSVIGLGVGVPFLPEKGV